MLYLSTLKKMFGNRKNRVLGFILLLLVSGTTYVCWGPDKYWPID